MLTALRNAFKVPDLRRKLLFTFFILAVFRLGAHIPVPGIDLATLNRQIEQRQQVGGVAAFLNLFSGGALTNFAIFALGIMPYITSSIIMQLLAVVIPRLEEWQKQGEVGHRQITKFTRYLTIVLALIQSTGLVFLFHSPENSPVGADVVPNFTPPRVALIVLTLTAGTGLIMWLGELITQRGIGNGMSLLIFAGIIAGLPGQGAAVYEQLKIIGSVIFLLIGLMIVVAIVLVEQGQRRIPVQYAKRIVGRRMTGGGSTYIPIKVNQAGVIPIIFASSVLYIPVLVSSAAPWKGMREFVERWFVNPATVPYIVLYAILILLFTFFYVAITFNPTQQADYIRKYGGFIPGIRPGRPTAEYLNKVLTRLTVPGSLFLALVAVVPSVIAVITGLPAQTFPFGGTTILIAVGVALETMRQIESQLLMRNYEGFLK
ncbi:MAG TPA: preprotein translocase subunit SecY [Actinomycetota bacterium]|nr:preprotein translocase subunit SecY [Actinomycetota bacterium]